MPSHAWIALEAIDPKANVFRRYILDVSEDLFGHWVVTRQWGRIGAASQRVTNSFARQDERDRYVNALPQCRRSAQKRTGVGYKVAAKRVDAETLIKF
ncbi:MAG: WGR domain-containing protein [Pseudomonadota bacterium]